VVILKKKWLAAVLAGALLAAALLSGCSSVETVKRLRFGVAGEGGIYREFGERFAALETDYNSMQDMLYGDVPTFETVIAAVQELEKEINTL
jgi:outer membrane murein-binding lipoprotein Lpp